jgi:hypothetical protein
MSDSRRSNPEDSHLKTKKCKTKKWRQKGETKTQKPRNRDQKPVTKNIKPKERTKTKQKTTARKLRKT